METVYSKDKSDFYQRKAEQGLRLAETAQRLDEDRRRLGKTLRVSALSQGNDGQVPSIRLSGKWLRKLGFEIGSEVVLIAAEGQIRIKRRDE